MIRGVKNTSLFLNTFGAFLIFVLGNITPVSLLIESFPFLYFALYKLRE